MRIRAVSVATVVLAATYHMVTPSAATAQDPEAKVDVKVAIKTFLDDKAKPAERELAVRQACSPTRVKLEPKKQEPVKKALAELLAQLEKNRKDEAYWPLIVTAFHSTNVFAPFPELGSTLKPYLGPETPVPIRTAALNEIEHQGASGVTKEIIAILQEPIVGSVMKNQGRDQLERACMRCTFNMPGTDALAILKFGISNSKFRGVRLVCSHILAEMCIERGPKDFDGSAVKAILLENARETNTDEEVACASALGLTHYGSYEGIGELLKRAEKDHRGGSREVYKTLCAASHQPRGFLEVAPERWYDLDTATRDNVKAAIKEWWAGAKDQKPDQSLFDALKAAGIQVPANLDTKEAIFALISGLELENREVRYAALDQLVRRTGRTEAAKKFKWLFTGAAVNGIQIQQPEPPEGWPDKLRQDQLLAQQKERAKEWRSWWEKASTVAVLKDGVWTGW